VAELRLRTDDWRDAGRWRAIVLGAVPDPRQHPETRWVEGWTTWLERNEPARPGDVWRVRQNPAGPNVMLSSGERYDWPIACYVLVCPLPRCPDGAHQWHHAYDCSAGDTYGAACKRGPGRLSCWDWSGSIEAGNLNAAPSLQVLPSDPPGLTCEYHGFLRQGVMTNA
jgi:hypothetical protein